MKPNPTVKIILLVLLSFAVHHFLFLNLKTIKSEVDVIIQQGLTSYILSYLIVGIPIFIGTYCINKEATIFKNLGLSKNMLTGIWTAALFALPMFLGALVFFKFNTKIEIQNLLAGTIVAGFMEELYFRGFLFGQLFRNTKLGFIPSIFLGACLFAFAHLHQSTAINELIGIFVITFSGAVLFAWLYAEWDYNLWVPIFTHTFMNLSWSLFVVDNTALGDVKANIFRGLTIAIAIIFTILYKKHKKQKLSINRNTIMLKKQNGT